MNKKKNNHLVIQNAATEFCITYSNIHLIYWMIDKYFQYAADNRHQILPINIQHTYNCCMESFKNINNITWRIFTNSERYHCICILIICFHKMNHIPYTNWVIRLTYCNKKTNIKSKLRDEINTNLARTKPRVSFQWLN